MPIITEAELRDRIRRPRRGMKVAVPRGARFSPAARDFIAQWGFEIVEETASPAHPEQTSPSPLPQAGQAAVGVPAGPRSTLRFRRKMDSVQALFRLTAARARSWQLPALARHLDELADHCQEIVDAEQQGRPVRPLRLAGMDETTFIQKKQQPGEDALHHAPTPEDHEMLHWLNYLRAQVREAQVDGVDTSAPPSLSEPTPPDLTQALESLINAIDYLALSFKTGKLSWRMSP